MTMTTFSSPTLVTVTVDVAMAGACRKRRAHWRSRFGSIGLTMACKDRCKALDSRIVHTSYKSIPVARRQSMKQRKVSRILHYNALPMECS
jgi:hypothetical protein